MAPAPATPSFDVVIPTIGRPSLQRLLDALAAQLGPLPGRIVVVQDRARRGPAAARNAGWRAGAAEWMVFLDDDVVPPPRWSEVLVRDLAMLAPGVGASQGRVHVPLPIPRHRRPTDWERNVVGLQQARWASADIAYRREALERAGGFDERFARAYREDSDLALRVQALGYTLVRGARSVRHPVAPAPFWHSVRLQRGNSDDALMRKLHGRRWRARAGAPRGRLPLHLLTAASALGGGALMALGSARVPLGSSRIPLGSACMPLGSARVPLGMRRRPAGGRTGTGRRLAAWRTGMALQAASLAGIAELAFRRIAPGPRTPVETVRMLATSAIIPFAASAHRLRGELRWRGAQPKPPVAPEAVPVGSKAVRAAQKANHTAPEAPLPIPEAVPATPVAPSPPAAVLFDRDGTLIEDVPYNGDPARVTLRPGAREALRRLREAGVPVAVISNQSGVARGLLDEGQVQAVNFRVEELLGRVDEWLYCPHGPQEGCDCRKPAPGLVLRAASSLGVRPERCAVVGDIGADVQAAAAAGARAVLVPNGRTRPEEIAVAPETAPDLHSAVELLLGAEGGVL